MQTAFTTATNRPFGELGVVVFICFGWFIFASLNAVASDFSIASFSDAAFLSLLLSEVVFASLALIYLRLRGYDLNWLRPKLSGLGCIIGMLLYVATALMVWPISQVVGASNVAAQPIREMLNGATFSLPMLVALSIVNGVYEETFLTGYLLQGLGHVGPGLSIGVVSLVRVMYHLYQGPIGATSALVFGIVVGLYYWRTRDLWSVMAAHIFGDFAGFAMA